MPICRALRRICVFVLLSYALFYLFARWPGSPKPPVNVDEALHLDANALKLRNAVDRVLDEAVLDILLAGTFSSAARTSRHDLKRILETQETLSSAQWRSNLIPDQPALNAPNTNDTSSLDAASLYVKVCSLLSGKRILFVGPETTFFLHTLWLEAQEKHEHQQADACFGRDYCTFHHICRAYPNSSVSLSQLSQGAASPGTDSVTDAPAIEMVGRKKKMPSKNTLRASGSSIVQYAMSSTLYAAKDPHDAGYTRPLSMVDPRTGVRMSNTYWLRRARKADVVVFSRAPVPAPAWTWSHGSDEAGLGKDVSGSWAYTEVLCTEHDFLDLGGCDGGGTLAVRLTNAALYATLHTFLPSVLTVLRDSIAADSELMRRSVLVWHGSWYVQPLCASRWLPQDVTLLHDIWSGRTIEDALVPKVDPWSFYHNAQVYMHERILPKTLPHFNITYVSLAVPAASQTGSLWNNDGQLKAEQAQYSPLHPKDCIRFPWPGFGARLEEIFKRSLVVVLQPAASPWM